MKIILCFLKKENTLLKPNDTHLLSGDGRPMPTYTNLLSVYTNLLSVDSRPTSIDSRPMPDYIHPGFANNRRDKRFSADGRLSAFS